jgi:flagellar basal body-associated protein FliL
MKKLVIGLSLLLVCLICCGVGFFFVPRMMGASVPAQGEAVAANQNTISLSLGESIVTNVKNSRRYLKVSLALELRDEKSKEYFEKNQYKIRDITIGVLRDKQEAELASPEALNMLKEDIKNALASQLDTSNLVDVHIYDFIMQ